MPYDPYAPDEGTRSRSFNVLWAGLPASILCLVFLIFAPSASFSPSVFGSFAAMSMITMVFAWSHDEYIQAHLWRASRWTLAAAGVMMMMGVFPGLRHLGLLSQIDLTMGMAILATVFHSALAINRLRR